MFIKVLLFIVEFLDHRFQHRPSFIPVVSLRFSAPPTFLCLVPRGGAELFWGGVGGWWGVHSCGMGTVPAPWHLCSSSGDVTQPWTNKHAAASLISQREWSADGQVCVSGPSLTVHRPSGCRVQAAISRGPQLPPEHGGTFRVTHGANLAALSLQWVHICPLTWMKMGLRCFSYNLFIHPKPFWDARFGQLNVHCSPSGTRGSNN